MFVAVRVCAEYFLLRYRIREIIRDSLIMGEVDLSLGSVERTRKPEIKFLITLDVSFRT